MTPHDHRELVPGCYRCELGRDEVLDAQRDEALERLIACGAVDLECKYCKENLLPAFEETGQLAFAPRHRASSMCRSGSRPHCTCDACF